MLINNIYKVKNMSSNKLTDLTFSKIFNILYKIRFYLLSCFFLILILQTIFIQNRDRIYEGLVILKPYKIEILNRYNDLILLNKEIAIRSPLRSTKFDANKYLNYTENKVRENFTKPTSIELEGGIIFDKFLEKLDSKKAFAAAYDEIHKKANTNTLDYEVMRNQEIFESIYVQRPYDKDINFPGYKLIVKTKDIEETDRLIKRTIQIVNQEIKTEYYDYFNNVLKEFRRLQRKEFLELLQQYKLILKSYDISIKEKLEQISNGLEKLNLEINFNKQEDQKDIKIYKELDKIYKGLSKKLIGDLVTTEKSYDQSMIISKIPNSDFILNNNKKLFELAEKDYTVELERLNIINNYFIDKQKITHELINKIDEIIIDAKNKNYSKIIINFTSKLNEPFEGKKDLLVIEKQLSMIINSKVADQFNERIEEFKNDNFTLLDVGVNMIFFKNISNNIPIFLLSFFAFLFSSILIFTKRFYSE